MKLAKRGHSPRIAFWDIETAPSIGAYFDLWKEGNIVWTQTPWYILSFAVKWSDENKIRTYALPDYSLYRSDKENDRELVKELWKVHDQADILVAHNGDRFDIKKTNARFLAHGLTPPSTYKTIDTLKAAKSRFKFDSNRLNDLGQFLGVGKKLPHTGSHLWQSCIRGDLKSWAIMRKYNAQDVRLLEQVYLKLRPWMTNHPNFNVYTGGDGCPKCESMNVQRRGPEVTATRKYQRFQCQDCGGWFKGDLIRAA